MRGIERWIGALFALAPLASLEAQTSTASVGRGQVVLTPEQRAQLKEDLRREVRAALVGELPAAAPEESPEAAKTPEVEVEAHKWEEPEAAGMNFFSLDGYLRVRSDLFHRLDLATTYLQGDASRGPYLGSPLVPICSAVLAGGFCAGQRGSSDTLGSANMRLRLEPELNVFEDVKIKMQLDVLDNLVLGSTPNTLQPEFSLPFSAGVDGQLPPSDGFNALMDSIRVKRLWGEVMTPLGQIRFGRMANHFGSGMLVNAGLGIDSDFGETVDRLAFATKIAGIYIMPGFDWAASGPTSLVSAWPHGQPFDREQRDDVDQLVLTVSKTASDEERVRAFSRGESVLNLGAYLQYRIQSLDSAEYHSQGEPNAQGVANVLEPRGASLLSGSAWVEWLRPELSLSAEFAALSGAIQVYPRGDIGTTSKVDVLAFGGLFNSEYRMLDDALRLRFTFVMATGDRAPGFGVRRQGVASPTPTPGDWDGPQDRDGSLTLFRFSQGYYVDLLFWRQIVGGISDALIFRPGAEYRFTDGLGIRLDLVYSRAWFTSSTPSAGTGSPSANLGLETDLRLFLETQRGFRFWLEYGLFLPFGGLDTPIVRPDNSTAVLSAKVAQTVQALIAVTF